ncbi:MAG: CPBP family intramembrane metalloprotease [Gemmataceae bacterium]|nr:CPBP family intramembrane metalloprotease [Gemmataceae bacterium]
MGDVHAFPADRSDPGTRGAWLGAMVFALVFPTVMAWVYFDALERPGTDRQPNPAMMIGYVVGKTLQFAFPVLCVLLLERRLPRPTAPNLRGLTFGLAFGIAVGAVILALYFLALRGTSLFRDTPAKIQTKLSEAGLLDPTRYIVLAVFISLIHSLMEEYYWRWFVFGTLERLTPWGWALGLSSLGFMAHHVVVLADYFPGRFWSLAIPLALCIAVGGAIWAWLYHKTQSIYAPWISHMLVDAAIMVVGYDLAFHMGP